MQNFVISFLVATVGFALLVNANTCSEAPTVKKADAVTKTTITDSCLDCICQASSDCDKKLKCHDNACGPYRIQKAYWLESGKPTMRGESTDSPNAYENCVIDLECAKRTIEGYMEKFKQDCNGDGVIDCVDFGAIHKLGGYACKNDWTNNYKEKFNKCWQQKKI